MKVREALRGKVVFDGKMRRSAAGEPKGQPGNLTMKERGCIKDLIRQRCLTNLRMNVQHGFEKQGRISGDI